MKTVTILVSPWKLHRAFSCLFTTRRDTGHQLGYVIFKILAKMSYVLKQSKVVS